MNWKGVQSIPKSHNEWSYRNITLRLNEEGGMQWWTVSEDCGEIFYQDVLSKLPHADCAENAVLYTFNDKLYPSSLGPYIAGG